MGGFPPSLCLEMLPSPLSHRYVQLQVGRGHVSAMREAGAAHIYHPPTPRAFLQVPGPPRQRQLPEGFPPQHWELQGCSPRSGKSLNPSKQQVMGETLSRYFYYSNQYLWHLEQRHMNCAGARRWAGTTANSQCCLGYSPKFNIQLAKTEN